MPATSNSGALSSITCTRMMRERKDIDPLMSEYDIKWLEKSTGGTDVKFSFTLNRSGNADALVFAEIKLDEDYPFSQPLIRYDLRPSQLAIFNHDEFKIMDFYCQKTYIPMMTVASIIPLIAEFGRKHIRTITKESRLDSMFSMVHTLYGQLGPTLTITFIVLLASFIRILVGLGPYSGYKDTPQFGDYEAQRHWMELTLHTPAVEWYVETRENDLTYWRLDYPPLSGYASYLFGYFSDILNPKSVELFYSRGFEDPEHKIYMRMSVLITDLVFFFSSVILLMGLEMRKYGFTVRATVMLLALLCPPFILIDHAHFQYNGAMHGLTLWAVYFCVKKHIIVGAILFSLALNFKQMGLYYSLAFFAFILGHLFMESTANRSQAKISSITAFVIRVIFVGGSVIATFVLMWLPWLSDKELLQSLVSAIFPVHRGLFQQQVPTFWFVTNMIVKWAKVVPTPTLIMISTVITLIVSLPSMYAVIVRPKLKFFKLALFNISMSFMLFSYHVHEKTILIPIIPLLFMIRYFNKYYFDFVQMATVILYPIICLDQQVLSWAVLIFGHHLIASYALEYLTEQGVLRKSILDYGSFVQKEKIVKATAGGMMEEQHSKVHQMLALLDFLYRQFFRKALLVAVLVTLICQKLIKPPSELPYLYEAILATLGFCTFAYITLMSNLFMFNELARVPLKDKMRYSKLD